MSMKPLIREVVLVKTWYICLFDSIAVTIELSVKASDQMQHVTSSRYVYLNYLIPCSTTISSLIQ